MTSSTDPLPPALGTLVMAPVSGATPASDRGASWQLYLAEFGIPSWLETRCRKCRRYFSVMTNTVMQGSKIGYQRWGLAIYLMNTHAKGISGLDLARQLGITHTTAWHMAHRIREAWSQLPEAFEGPVEVDETYIGRKRGKKARFAGDLTGMTIVAGMKDRATWRISAAVVKATARRTCNSSSTSGRTRLPRRTPTTWRRTEGYRTTRRSTAALAST